MRQGAGCPGLVLEWSAGSGVEISLLLSAMTLKRSPGEVQVDLLAPALPPPHSPVCSPGGWRRLMESGAERGVCLGDPSRPVASQWEVVPVP